MGFFDQHMKHAEHVQPQQQAPTANQQPQINPPIQPQLQQRAVTPFPISNEMISCADQIKGQGRWAKRFKTIAYHEEQFRPYPKDTRYYVGTLGTVYDSVNNTKLFPFRVHRGLNPLTFNHYLAYYLNGSTTTGHRMVAETFLPKPEDPNANIVNHKNGIKSDNRVDNLEWVTHKQNAEHAYRTGLIQHHLKGEDTPQAKFSNKEIEEICKMLEDEIDDRDIALKFGFTPSKTNKEYLSFLRLCHNIRYKICWKFISQNYNIRKKGTHYHEESEIEKICQMMQSSSKSYDEIAKAVGMENNVKFRAFLTKIRAKIIYPHITEKYTFKAMQRKKLTDDEVWKILEMRLIQKKMSSEIANEMGYADTEKAIHNFKTTVSQITKGQTFSEVREEFRKQYGI